ncbi:MAG: hypothetical protein QOG80_811, partial [Pseudonocardiales bacterium]|nr:hypothetical protein [Pseudonocardiales bacterium]
VSGLPAAGRHKLRIDTFDVRGKIVRRSVRTLDGCSDKGRPHTRGRYRPRRTA